jgi:hypothetical protein
MKTPLFHIIRNLPVVLLVLVTSGCATPALWKATAIREWKPCLPTEVLLIETAGRQPDAAVLFDQWNELTHEYRPVAWRLSQSPTNLSIGSKAVGQLTKSIAPTRTIPLFTVNAVPSDVSSAPPGYAVWDWSGKQLTIHLDGYTGGPRVLPTSHTARRTTLRVIATPLAVTADAAIVGAVLMAIGASGYMGR